MHTGYIQASRALMIAAIVFGTFGLVATLAGMQCSKIGGENYVLKGRIAAIGGVFFLLQGKDLGMDGCGHVTKKAPKKHEKMFGQKSLQMSRAVFIATFRSPADNIRNIVSTSILTHKTHKKLIEDKESNLIFSQNTQKG